MPVRQQTPCCRPHVAYSDLGKSICCTEYSSFLGFGISYRSKTADVSTNATYVDDIVTDPAHGESGWYQSGEYEETWNLMQTQSSGPDTVVNSYLKGYTWTHPGALGEKVVSILDFDPGDLAAEYIQYDDRVEAGPGQYYLLDSSRLFDLAGPVVESDVKTKIDTLINEQEWVSSPEANPPVNLGGAGLSYDASGGVAEKMQYRIDGGLDPIGEFDGSSGEASYVADDPAPGFTVDWTENEGGGMEVEYSGLLTFWESSGGYSENDPGPDSTGGFTDLPYERDEVWTVSLTDDFVALFIDLAYVVERWYLATGASINGQGLALGEWGTGDIPGYRSAEHA